MNKIYCFSLFNTGYISVHSLIRELFDSPKTVCPSYWQGNLLYVLSRTSPAKPLHYDCYDIETVEESVKDTNLEVRIAFCNRGRDNAVPKKIYHQEALNKFCFLSGLQAGQETKSIFLGPHGEEKFNIHNSFYIKGLFQIVNHNKFNQVLINGIGSRKSYGYGLILTKQGGKNGAN